MYVWSRAVVVPLNKIYQNNFDLCCMSYTKIQRELYTVFILVARIFYILLIFLFVLKSVWLFRVFFVLNNILFFK